MVLGSFISFQFHSLTCSCPVFPAPVIEEAVFSTVYILASFIKDKVTSLCLFVGAFYPFTFKIVIDMYDPITIFFFFGCVGSSLL